MALVLRDDGQQVVAVAFELDRTDAGYGEQTRSIVGPPGGDLGEGLVVEDDEGGHAGRLGLLRAPPAELLEQRVIVGAERRRDSGAGAGAGGVAHRFAN